MTFQDFKQKLVDAVSKELGIDSDLEIIQADPKFADLAIPLHKYKVDKLDIKLEGIESSEVVGGFFNIRLNSRFLAEMLLDSGEDFGKSDIFKGQQVVVEHTDPNPFKQLHIGHVYSNTVGESIARIFEAGGAKVHRVSYHGDVGLHVAKGIWGIQQLLGDKNLEDIEDKPKFLGEGYALGSKKYDEEESVQRQVKELNKQIYALDDPELEKLYTTTRGWSFEYFESVYARLGTSFEKQYFERDSGQKGLEIVKDNMGVFEESEGAVVFKGESHGLHTRVFVNSQGLPTYEAKDLGLAYLKAEDYDYDKSIIITGNEVDQYFQVVLKTLESIDKDLAEATTHLSHGMVKLADGKMSSRTGKVITAVELLDMVEGAVRKRSDISVKENSLAAIKYSFLKSNIGSDIVFNLDESISLEGNSGPYIQYAAVRAKSILAKAEDSNIGGYDWKEEHSLLMKLMEYPDIVQSAAENLSPHEIANYIYSLAREMNKYYENVPVLKADKEKGARIAILKKVVQVFESSLGLMGITIPDKM